MSLKKLLDSELISDYFHSQTEAALLRITPCHTPSEEQARDRQIRKTESYMREIAEELGKRGKLDRIVV